MGKTHRFSAVYRASLGFIGSLPPRSVRARRRFPRYTREIYMRALYFFIYFFVLAAANLMERGTSHAARSFFVHYMPRCIISQRCCGNKGMRTRTCHA